jgi:CubicO group peptidase (beta-lactamase class C family)
LISLLPGITGPIYAQSPVGQAAKTAPEVTLEKVKAALTELEKIAQQTVARNGVPGLAIAVVYRDEVVYLKGFGVRETGKNDPVTPDTVFQIASMSKPISATVVAALVSDGVVSWDDSIVTYLPGFALYDPYVTREVTIRDMFAHRSGLPGSAGNDLEDLGYDRDEILTRLRYLKPASSFRSGYAYSNFGLTAGGVAASRAAGKTWEEVAAAKLYQPLGMRSTSSRFADYTKATNRSSLHVPQDGIAGQSSTWVPRFSREPDAQAPAGGVSSTASDLAQWVRLELGNGIFNGKPLIKPEALAETHLPHIVRGANPVTGAPGFYGLGWNIDYDDKGRVFWDHAGAFSVGGRTEVKLLAAEKLGIVVLSNAFPTGVPDGLSDAFFDQVLNGKQTRDWIGFWNGKYGELVTAMAGSVAEYAKPPATVSPALPLSAYVGIYGNDYVGRLEVREEGGKLTLRLGNQKQASPLRHWDRDTFLYLPAPELPGAFAGVTFVCGADGKSAQVLLESFDGEAAVFTRRPDMAKP